MGAVTGDEEDTQKEEDENENGEIDNFGSQVSLNNSTYENEAYRKHGEWLFGLVW